MMNCFSIRRFGMLGISILLLLSSCQKDHQEEDLTTVILAENVVYLTPSAWKESIIKVDSSNFTLTFKDNSKLINELEVGHFIVTDVGNGLLLKAVSIKTQPGTVTVATSQAVLTDIFQQAVIKFETELSAENISSIQYQSEGIQWSDKRLKSSNGLVWELNGITFDDGSTVSGQFACSWDLVTTIRIQNFQVKEIHFGFGTNQSQTLIVNAPAHNTATTSEKELMTIEFGPFSIPIAGIWVTFKPKAKLIVGATIDNVNPTSFQLTQDQSFNAGLQYFQGRGWSSYKESTRDVSITTPNAVNAFIRGYLKPQLEILVYNMAGPYCNLEVAGRIAVNTQAAPGDPWWTVYRGVAMNIGVKINVLRWDFFAEEEIFSFEELVAAATSSLQYPTMHIDFIRNITPNSAAIEWGISDQGDFNIIERGICWNTVGSPTINDQKTMEGQDIGEFISVLQPISSPNTYSIRAYNIANGENYSMWELKLKPPTGTFTDPRDNQTYNTINIGNQVWMAENLAYLPEVSPRSEFSHNLFYTDYNYYVYGFDGHIVDDAKATVNFNRYGVLYNYFSAVNACPDGWRLPSDQDYKDLESYLGLNQSLLSNSGFRGDIGKRMKSGFNWSQSQVYDPQDPVGFNALPTGWFSASNVDAFLFIGSETVFWTSTSLVANPQKAMTRYLRKEENGMGRISSFKNLGLSVRCLKN